METQLQMSLHNGLRSHIYVIEYLGIEVMSLHSWFVCSILQGRKDNVDMTPKVQATKEKNGLKRLHQNKKTFYPSKDPVKKVKK